MNYRFISALFGVLVLYLVPSLSQAANITAWFYICTDATGTVCSAQQLTLPDATASDWLTSNQAALINVMNNQSTLAAAAFDPDIAGQFFAWGLTGVVLVGFAAWGCGQVLGFINTTLGSGRH